MYSSRRALLMVKWFEKTLFYFNILSCHRCSQKDFRMQIQELAVVTGDLRVERRMDYQQLGGSGPGTVSPAPCSVFRQMMSCSKPCCSDCGWAGKIFRVGWRALTPMADTSLFRLTRSDSGPLGAKLHGRERHAASGGRPPPARGI